MFIYQNIYSFIFYNKYFDKFLAWPILTLSISLVRNGKPIIFFIYFFHFHFKLFCFDFYLYQKVQKTTFSQSKNNQLKKEFYT